MPSPGCAVSKSESHKVEPAEVYRVTSGNSGRVYFVDVRPEGVTCSCEAGERGIFCSHRRAVEAFALKALEGK